MSGGLLVDDAGDRAQGDMIFCVQVVRPRAGSRVAARQIPNTRESHDSARSICISRHRPDPVLLIARFFDWQQDATLLRRSNGAESSFATGNVAVHGEETDTRDFDTQIRRRSADQYRDGQDRCVRGWLRGRPRTTAPLATDRKQGRGDMTLSRHRSTPVVFWLNRHDEIVRVNSGWNEFAQENDGADCVESHVVGQTLWDFVSGTSSRMLIGALILRSRAFDTIVEWDYRCDSPRMKRFMRMRIAPDDGLLRLEHRIVRTLPLLPPLTFLTAGERDSTAIVRCSACSRLNIGEDWLEPDEALARRVIDRTQAVIHDACPECLDAVMPRPVTV